VLNKRDTDRGDLIETRLADYQNVSDANAIIDLIDRYAQDPMGGGKPLPQAVREQMITGMANMPGSFVVLASVEEQTVGCATCFMGFSTFKARPLVNIHDLCVDAQWRNRGVGQRLIQAVAEEAQRRGCCKVTLEVRQDNPAQRLYQRSGFTSGEVSMWFLHKDL
jgi:GNAT superfamily N-acetyltransferase